MEPIEVPPIMSIGIPARENRDFNFLVGKWPKFPKRIQEPNSSFKMKSSTIQSNKP